MRWFRMYTDAVDNPKLKLLAFEDRWHYVAFCCLKRSGLLDNENDPMLERKIAVKLGVQLRELDEIKRRLIEVNLIEDDCSPVNWNERQYISDNSTDRVRKHRERKKKQGVKRVGNVSVTPSETDTESDTEKKKPPAGANGKYQEPDWSSVPNLNVKAWQRWLEDRGRRKLPKYKTTREAQRLAALPPEQQAACVDNSFDRYVGLFPEKFTKAAPPSVTDERMREWKDD